MANTGKGADASHGSGIGGQLMELLEYREVLGVLATTLDGLVVAHVGLNPDDAEVLAATSSSQPDDAPYSAEETRGGVLHVLRGQDVRLIVLTEASAPKEMIADLMATQLAQLEAMFAV